MSHPLDGARAKVSRADEHLQALVDDLRGRHPDTKEDAVHVERDGRWYVVLIDPLPQRDTSRPAAICGDLVNNLGSAFDYIVCELASARTKKQPSRWNAFPMCTAPGQFQDAVVKPQVPKTNPLLGIEVGGPAWTLIEASQPYNGPEPAIHPLALIGRFWRRDKHRALYVGMHFPDFVLEDLIGWHPSAWLAEERRPGAHVAHEGRTEIARFRLGFPKGVDPGVHVKGALAIDPTFGEEDEVGVGAIQITIRGFGELIEYTRTAVEIFSLFF